MRVVPPSSNYGRWYWHIPTFGCVGLGLLLLAISFFQPENLPPPTLTRGNIRITAVVLLALAYLVYLVQRQRLTLQLFDSGLNEIELIESVKKYADQHDWLLLDSYGTYYYYCETRLIRKSPEISIIIKGNKLYINILYDNKIIDDFILNLRYREHDKRKETQPSAFVSVLHQQT